VARGAGRAQLAGMLLALAAAISTSFGVGAQVIRSARAEVALRPAGVEVRLNGARVRPERVERTARGDLRVTIQADSRN
jgi:hypothetical protein